MSRRALAATASAAAKMSRTTTKVGQDTPLSWVPIQLGSDGALAVPECMVMGYESTGDEVWEAMRS